MCSRVEHEKNFITCGPGLSFSRGWSGGAIMLNKFPVSERPANSDNSRARAHCACSRCGRGLFGHLFVSSIIFPTSPI